MLYCAKINRDKKNGKYDQYVGYNDDRNPEFMMILWSYSDTFYIYETNYIIMLIEARFRARKPSQTPIQAFFLNLDCIDIRLFTEKLKKLKL